MNMKRTSFLSITLTIALCGCASDGDLRQSSRTLSLYVDQARENAVTFAQDRDRIAKARLATLNFLQANALASEQNIQTELAMRDITQDKDWNALFEGLRKSPALITKQRQERQDLETSAQAALKGAKSAVAVKAGKLTEASSALATLGEDKSTADELKFYWDFIKEVDTAIKKKSDDAKAVAGQAADASESKNSVK